MNEHRFAGWDPFDDSHVKHDNEICTIMNCKDIQDETAKIEKEFEPDDCTNYNESYGVCDYPCDDCLDAKSYNQCMEN